MIKDFHNIKKYCLVCNKQLILNNTRDIERKKYCSYKCRGIDNAQKNNLIPPMPTRESRKKAGKTISRKMKLGLISKPPRKEKTKYWNCDICNKPTSQGSTRCRECYLKTKNIEIKCAFCGISMIYKKSRIKAQENFFCNKSCKLNWNNIHKIELGKYNCPICGKMFEKYKSMIKTENPCCSVRCASYMTSKKGNESIFYIDGRTPLRKQIKNSYKYGEWRHNVFNRDDYKCVECSSNKNIHAHHIISFSQLLDKFMIKIAKNRYQKSLKYKSLWNINNGITLCENCHAIRHPDVNFMKIEKAIQNKRIRIN